MITGIGKRPRVSLVHKLIATNILERQKELEQNLARIESFLKVNDDVLIVFEEIGDLTMQTRMLSAEVIRKATFFDHSHEWFQREPISHILGVTEILEDAYKVFGEVFDGIATSGLESVEDFMLSLQDTSFTKVKSSLQTIHVLLKELFTALSVICASIAENTELLYTREPLLGKTKEEIYESVRILGDNIKVASLELKSVAEGLQKTLEASKGRNYERKIHTVISSVNIALERLLHYQEQMTPLFAAFNPALELPLYRPEILSVLKKIKVALLTAIEYSYGEIHLEKYCPSFANPEMKKAVS